ncbi:MULTISPECIES: hypothetical protein [Chryseobacterium]|jgi:hypothetical protein|uniref:hypothetical protein n=1 Tax=Chryseobacterium TaxID=59732 RepID=UPI001A6276E7|nr:MULTISPECIES: hypothetical protein [Chryseobacterium]MBL7879775.1 hypothetical protein [Chryseobacterium gambrini]MCY1659813.1 hypothetical protein [Chryseobacterium sp. SL1]WBX95595.1 hypothetical protein PE065_11985 [Chryseobacterium gambrini]
MKRLFYFVLLLVGISTIHSCKDLLDEDGNPLVDINDNTGLNGPRALYREITDSDTLATYYYNGLQLSKVVTDSMNSTTDLAWSGDKVSRIDFKGFLDLNGNGKLDKDSVIFTQQFTYGSTGRIETISENRSFFKRSTTAPYTPLVPGPQTLYKKTKTLYTLKYAAATAKLDSIIMRNGPEASGTPFVYTSYSKTKYEYAGDNVSKVTRNYGPMGSTGSFGSPTTKLGYEFTNYDTKINPFTLIPNAYKISRLLSTEANDVKSWILSPNSPQRYSVTDLGTPIPTPVVFSTNYNYDAQTYMQKGYGVNYIYKPL